MTSRSIGARLRLVVVVSMVAAALALAPSAASPVVAAQTLSQGCTLTGSSHPVAGGFRAGQWATSVTQGCSPGDPYPLSGGYRAGHWVP